MHPLVALLLAGAAQVDVTPTWWPVIVNCFMTERTASEVQSPVYAKAVVLARGDFKTAMVVVDSCMMPRELIDAAKSIAFEKTGIPVDRQMISATHTHMAPAAMTCLGSRVDEKYAAWLPGKIAEAIVAANARLKPARVGSFAVEDSEHTFVRQFFYRSDQKLMDPFGVRSVHANMHPGYENPDMTMQTGPKDPTLTVLAVQGVDGTPISMMANYAMHYFNSKPISSDYFGEFAKQFAARVSAPSDYVVVLSQGVSGDLMWMDYSRPQMKDLTIETYVKGLVDSAEKAFRSVKYEAKVNLKMVEVEETFARRVADEARLDWARAKVEEFVGREPKSQPEIYAREQLHISKEPLRKVKLQVMQVGELAMAAWPNEVFSISGLKLRERTGFRWLMNVTLANGAEGYIPPAELHPFGGYTTWAAKTASLEVGAEARMVSRLAGMLDGLKPSKRPVAASKEYWGMEELAGRADVVVDGLKAFAVPGKVGRAMYVSGGTVTLSPRQKTYTLEFWMWPALTTRQWTPVRIEQTRLARKLFVDGKLVSEGKPLEKMLLVERFEGAVDEVRLKH